MIRVYSRRNNIYRWVVFYAYNKNSDKSLMLCSDKIITFKPFDAAESGITAKADKSSKIDLYRQQFGSNRWMNSNIREWLNSVDKRVKYSTKSPEKDAVYSKVNSYATEPGFLYNFTTKERNKLVTMESREILPQIDLVGKYSGIEVFMSVQQVKGMLANYSNSYYVNIKEKVSLLDIKQVNDYFIERGWEYKKSPTQIAMEKSERLWNNKTIKELYANSSKKYWFYWLRTPSATLTSIVRIIDMSGNPVECGANNGSCGVVPIITLKMDVKAISGNGKLTNPYIIAE